MCFKRNEFAVLLVMFVVSITSEAVSSMTHQERSWHFDSRSEHRLVWRNNLVVPRTSHQTCPTLCSLCVIGAIFKELQTDEINERSRPVWLRRTNVVVFLSTQNNMFIGYVINSKLVPCRLSCVATAERLWSLFHCKCYLYVALALTGHPS